MVMGRRGKSEPFGEKPIDIVLLTVPSIATGIVILAGRILRRERNRSVTSEEPTQQ
jgi:hypothetical protein